MSFDNTLSMAEDVAKDIANALARANNKKEVTFFMIVPQEDGIGFIEINGPNALFLKTFVDAIMEKSQKIP